MADRLLLIDDDDRLGSLLRAYLADHGFVLERAGTLALGRQALSRGGFDALILDRMLPDGDGMTLCRELRASSSLPIVMLTAMGEETDRIVGLELGADDYLQKPMNPRELVARLRALLRRARASVEAGGVLRFGALEIDRGARAARKNGVRLDLTAHQLALLTALAERPGRVMSREQLLDAIGEDMSLERSVDVHISRIRSLVEDDPKAPSRIQTVRGAGYVFSGA